MEYTDGWFRDFFLVIVQQSRGAFSVQKYKFQQKCNTHSIGYDSAISMKDSSFIQFAFYHCI